MDYGPEPKAWEEGPAELRMTWSDGHVSRHPYQDLRAACPCAVCRTSRTSYGLPGDDPGSVVRRGGSPDPPAVPADVRPSQIGRVGRYAITFVWSDGHQTGIYTYELLRDLCACHLCRP